MLVILCVCVCLLCVCVCVRLFGVCVCVRVCLACACVCVFVVRVHVCVTETLPWLQFRVSRVIGEANVTGNELILDINTQLFPVALNDV